MRPAALASAMRASITALFSQWTPVRQPNSRSRFNARYRSPSGSIMAG